MTTKQQLVEMAETLTDEQASQVIAFAAEINAPDLSIEDLSEGELQALDRGIADVENGNVIDGAEFKRQMAQILADA